MQDPARADVIEDAPVRGGVSLGAVLTGLMVALGLMTLIGAPVALIAWARDLDVYTMTRTDVIRAAWTTGIALAVVGFLAFTWGGYTAGRMSRGAGMRNGLLVAIFAIVLTAIGFGVTAAVTGVSSPIRMDQLAVTRGAAMTMATTFGIAGLVAMLLGGMLGGFMGSRWHTKLERRVVERRRARRPLFHRRAAHA